MKHHGNRCWPLLALTLLSACAPVAAPLHPSTAHQVRVLGAVTASEQNACEEAVSTVLVGRGSSCYADVEVTLGIDVDQGIDPDSVGALAVPAAFRPVSNSQPRFSAEIACRTDGKLVRAAALGLVTAGACTSAAHRLAAELERQTGGK
jgi:hypothetical protein